MALQCSRLCRALGYRVFAVRKLYAVSRKLRAVQLGTSEGAMLVSEFVDLSHIVVLRRCERRHGLICAVVGG